LALGTYKYPQVIDICAQKSEGAPSWTESQGKERQIRKRKRDVGRGIPVEQNGKSNICILYTFIQVHKSCIYRILVSSVSVMCACVVCSCVYTLHGCGHINYIFMIVS